MPFEPQRIHDLEWAFSTKKQTDYATILANGDLTKKVAVIGTDIAELSKASYSDVARFGKGHEWPTTRRELIRDLRFQRSMDLSSLMAGWAAAFLLGSVSSVQPNAGGNPTAWRHTITFASAAASKSALTTTIYEQLSSQAAFQRKMQSLAVEGFTISGRFREVAQLQMNLVGSGQITETAVSAPSLTSVSLLDLGAMLFKIGTQGAPTDITERLIDFSVSLAQNLDADNGYHPGSGKFRKRIWFGNRRATFSATVWVDLALTDLYTRWRDDTISEVSFKLIGDTIGSGPEQHDCEILFPACRLTAAQIGEQDGKLIYRISAGEDDVYKGAGGTPDEPVRVTVTNTQTGYLTV